MNKETLYKSMTNFRTKTKLALKIIGAAYAFAYTAFVCDIAYDHVTRNSKRLKQDPTTNLVTHKFEADVNGIKKQITIAGEIHNYNQKEHDLGERLVSDHDTFASEKDVEEKGLSLKNKSYLSTHRFLMKFSEFYYLLGCGRNYNGIADIAKSRGYKVHTLEDANLTLDRLSSYKYSLFSDIGSAAIGPIFYFEGKKFGNYNASASLYSNPSTYNLFITSRDKMMGDKLADLLKQDNIDNLLVTVGRDHLDGVISNLAEIVPITELPSNL